MKVDSRTCIKYIVIVSSDVILQLQLLVLLTILFRRKPTYIRLESSQMIPCNKIESIIRRDNKTIHTYVKCGAARPTVKSFITRDL